MKVSIYHTPIELLNQPMNIIIKCVVTQHIQKNNVLLLFCIVIVNMQSKKHLKISSRHYFENIGHGLRSYC